MRSRARRTASFIRELALYRTYWKTHVKKAFGARLPSSITQHELQKWVARLSNEMAAASVRRLVRFLAALLQSAVETGRLTASPARGLKLPKRSAPVRSR